MNLDNDLLDVHTHAKEVCPDGVRSLVEEYQRERNVLRGAISEIYDLCLANDMTGNARTLRYALDQIKLKAGEAQVYHDLHSIDWFELVHE